MESQREATIPKRTFIFPLDYLYLLVFLISIDIYLFHYANSSLSVFVFVFVAIGIISLVSSAIQTPTETTISRKNPFNLSLKALLVLALLTSIEIFLFHYSFPSFVITTIVLIVFIVNFSPLPNFWKICILVLISLSISISLFLIKNYIDRERGHPSSSGLSLVCVARSDIPKGTKINSDHISYRSMPRKYKPRNAYFWRDRSQLFGLISTQKIKGRDYFMDNQFKK